ncbi:MAG: hypothetical protein LBM71_05510 [Elusimicrobiota bacterium]|jgi:dihydrofolate synthase/folylpolyglutamate synthase|nr:hypothetical protein [Elusimicrobiota bacterium]
MTYASILKIIQNQRGHGNKKNNLQAVKKTAAALGLSKLNFKIIHIAGTNGKGTTAALLALSLEQAGFKTGLFTSPHLYLATERIKINSKDISKKNFALYVEKVLQKETISLKFFEILTLAALLYFKDNKIDYAVLETGLGGLLDSTNIVKPILSIITSISLDHSDILGKTIKEIAAQKGGIIKSAVPCLIGSLPPDAKKVIKEIALIKKSRILTLGNHFKFCKIDFKNLTTCFTYKNQKFKLNLLGRKQALNAALVLAACEYLKIDFKFCAKAFSLVKMPCRFEVCQITKGKKYLIKDGAHNPAALKEFVLNYKKSLFYKPNNTLIFSAMQDKDYKSNIKILSPHFKNIALTIADTKRNVPLQNMAPLFKQAKVALIQNPSKINFKALSGNIIALGSFYLCSALRLNSM